MKLKKTKTKQEGFIVIVVLCMIICLAVLLVGFNYQSRTNLHAVGDFQKSAQALNCAKAGLNIAIAAIKNKNEDNTNKTSLNLISRENTFDIGNGSCSIIITEENAKLNVNLLKDKSGKPDSTRIEQVLRLIDLLNKEEGGYSHIGYGLVPAIIDWTDSDDNVTHLPFIKFENTGEESGYYSNLETPYRCRNGSLETTEELLLVKGITQDVFERIRDYITVYGDGKININCASKRVIESLSEKMDAALAQIIIDRRKSNPFESIAELRDIPGMTDGIYNTIKKTVTVSPADQYCHVTSRGDIGNNSCTVVAILRKNMKTKNIEVILYKEF
ncbi:MAG: type II secretion system minor pseudopilin GspK [Planctomycetota bacterium]|jgi:general secretion pathway protein K